MHTRNNPSIWVLSTVFYIEILAQQTSLPKESVAKNLNYIDPNAKFWTDDLKTWSDWYLKNGLIQKPIDENKVVDSKLYNEALKLIDKK
ncbi:hypothetical protein [Neobacillus vireti]|uniref:hypothetical protein n=1 Tax=Neobacillus vireti TaxID=220686 RepID=UPI003000836F